MTAQILAGAPAAAAVEAGVATRVAALREAGHGVGLATVMVGADPASAVYVRNKHRAATAVGMESFDVHLPETCDQEALESTIRSLNEDDRVHGMIVQLPLPDGLDEQRALLTIDPAKDADGLHPHNLGLLVLDRPGPRPATPSGILALLAHHQISVAGKETVIVGRSLLVGRPLALMLAARGVDATVTLAHSRTRDLASVTSRAELLVVAVGVPRLIGLEHVREEAVVVDVGISRVDDGLVGDVDAEAIRERAFALTPVPGGVGPMTVAALLENTIAAAERAAQ